jgi:hypothetical protein
VTIDKCEGCSQRYRLPKPLAMALLSRTCLVILTGLLALVASACGGSSNAGPASVPEVKLTVSSVPLGAYRADPRDCIVGTRGAEVRLAARPNIGGGLCRQLAARYLPGARNLSWPMLKRERDAPTLVCAVSRGRAFIAVLIAANDSGRVDPDPICERLHADGWRKHGVLDPHQ